MPQSPEKSQHVKRQRVNLHADLVVIIEHAVVYEIVDSGIVVDKVVSVTTDKNRAKQSYRYACGYYNRRILYGISALFLIYEFRKKPHRRRKRDERK